MKALEWPQDNMLIFCAQGQITPKSVVGSGRNSNSSKFLCMCLLPAKNEEDPMKNEFAGVATTFFSIISLWEFFDSLKGS